LTVVTARSVRSRGAGASVVNSSVSTPIGTTSTGPEYAAAIASRAIPDDVQTALNSSR